ncbi:helix-turn-helix domain-containing protein [Roseibium aestuarii]|uniref:Helix-turn-helix domain-containing protein n=1 Tax=Roseibium aestuarii TaxID=2600299 RepID=A0ABW4JX79_9HYPH|nr:helix-turn-helix transcriptional regulator [Roseibium aestuarii]
MEKNEHSLLPGPLSDVPPQALALWLARTPIRMQHGPAWRIDKINPVHDLVVCLSGGGSYRIGQEAFEVRAGEAFLIRRGERFRGVIADTPENYTGFAQHFSLELFGRTDLLSQMRLRRVARLPDWPALEPLAIIHRSGAGASATTLAQHHQFMLFLLAYLQVAFEGWQSEEALLGSQDQLSLQIMLAASHLSSDPLDRQVLERVMAEVPYNADYFRRAFRERIGFTPQKYLELKKMEYAVHRLGKGQTVKETAAELGYSDPYFFSRMFRQYIGASPSSYRLKRSTGRPFDYVE